MQKKTSCGYHRNSQQKRAEKNFVTKANLKFGIEMRNITPNELYNNIDDTAVESENFYKVFSFLVFRRRPPDPPSPHLRLTVCNVLNYLD